MIKTREKIEGTGWKAQGEMSAGVLFFTGDFLNLNGNPVELEMLHVEDDSYTEVTKINSILKVKETIFKGYITLGLDWNILMRFLGLRKS